MNFKIVARENWSDYSDCDATIALRDPPDRWVHDKPASKLVNAWQAGVPSILGCESSYRALGTPGVNYLEAASVRSLKLQLLRLRDDAALIASLVAAGAAQFGQASNERTARMWIETVDEKIAPRYQRWRRDPLSRMTHEVRRKVLEGLVWRTRMIGTRFVDVDRQ